MAEVIGEPGRATSVRPHARWVRISHWMATASVLTLTFTGIVILMAHPRRGRRRRLRIPCQQVALGGRQRSFACLVFDDGGQKGNIQNGWAWYTGI